MGGSDEPTVPAKIINHEQVNEGSVTEGMPGDGGVQEYSKAFHSVQSDAFSCNGETENQASKLYGYPRRRKVSAIRDFPPGCGPFIAKTILEGCSEMSKNLLLPNETVLPTTVTSSSDDILPKTVVSSDDIEVKIDMPSKAVVSEVIIVGCSEVATFIDEKNPSDGENVVERPSEEMAGKALDEGNAEEIMNASTEFGKPNSPLQNGLGNVEDDNICESVLYGRPKRRRISAVREFPSGCGASKISPGTKQYVTTGSSSKHSSLEDGKSVFTVETTDILERSGHKKSQKSILAGGSKGEDKFNNVRHLKEKSSSKISKTVGQVRLEKVVKSPSLTAKGVGETGVQSSSIFESKMKLQLQTEDRVLDVKPIRIKTSVSNSENIQKKNGDKGSAVKHYSNEKIMEDHSKKFSARKESSEHNRSKALTIYAKGEVESYEDKSLLKKPVDDKHGKSVKNQRDRLALEPGVVDRKKSLAQKMGEEADLEALGEKIIVVGLMAAPNCPWRHGRGSVSSARRKDRKPNNKLDVSSTSNQLEIVPAGNDDSQLNLDNHLSSDDENEIDVPVRQRSSLGASLRDHVPFNTSMEMDGEEVTRNKVRRTLRLFQAICRKLLQEEESKVQGGKKGRRIDLDAAAILKEKNQCVNTGKPILGPVPGVEIGDEFHFRSELSVVGLHRPYQGGIDYLKIGNTVVATSIVSGGNEDEMEGSDILIYSGSGGSAGTDGKPPEDQKLERGNLSLKNSIEAQTPVRVIRGSKEKADSRDGKQKPISTYVYDGLYMVEKYWKEKVQQGYFALKFQLRRIPGQPELPIKVVKKSGKSSSRPGVCIKDISDGKEGKPICVVNTIDNEHPLPFKYITKIRYPSSCVHAPPRGCDCTDGCSDSDKCACAVKNGGEIPFTYGGAIVLAKPLVYECGPSCKCPSTCHNRVSQHGIKIQLEVFKTESRGWGVRSLSSISSGSFVCEYVGELLPDEEAEKRSNDEYLFDIGNNYDDATLWEGLPTNMLPMNATESVEDSGYAIDAGRYGNVGRFINHSCSPNLYAQNVLYDHDDQRMPHIMLFAAENIPPLQELTYHYNYKIGEVRDRDGNEKTKDCRCGSHECSGRLY